MSIQRVFESARKLGVPVIMTDPAGREPMVVLSLEQFEAMIGEGHPAHSQQPAHPQSVPVSPAISGQQVNHVTKIPLDTQESLDSSDTDSSDIPLEERFYLEPVDDENHD